MRSNYSALQTLTWKGLWDISCSFPALLAAIQKTPQIVAHTTFNDDPKHFPTSYNKFFMPVNDENKTERWQQCSVGCISATENNLAIVKTHSASCLSTRKDLQIFMNYSLYLVCRTQNNGRKGKFKFESKNFWIADISEIKRFCFFFKQITAKHN